MNPQPCTKCKSLPEDILMLACNHDLCLECAGERLAFEMKKRKNANSIVCEFCYERTPLDEESIAELEKLMPKNTVPARNYAEPSKGIELREIEKKYEPPARSQPFDRMERQTDRYKVTSEIVSKPQYEPYQRSFPSSAVPRQVESFPPSKKNCPEHQDQEILYFCFDCKCECICPECVIHGKHKDHEVKTIKKSYPIVKSQLQGFAEKIQNNVESLLIKRSEIEKSVRALTEQNNLSKRQIQQAFEDLRQKISAQQKEILSRCDQSLNESLEEFDRSSKTILQTVDNLKNSVSMIGQSTKKEEITFLNFYARKWKQIHEDTRQKDITIQNYTLPTNEPVLAAVLDTIDQVSRIGSNRFSGGNKY